MKVALVCPYDLGAPGGVQDQVIRLAGWLEDLGHEAVVIGPGEEGPPGAVLLGATKEFTSNRASTPISVTPKVGAAIREAGEDADVVHIHEPLMPTVGLAAARAKGLGPKVGTFHADPPRWVRRGYRIGGRLARRVTRHLDATTATSPVSRSAVAGIADPVIVPNGVEIAAYDDGPKVADRVMFLGRDDERKGLDVLLAAWPAVKQRVPAATLSVVGAERVVDDASITFHGRISDEAKRAELAAAQVFCAPNLGGESFGIILVEAMASGCAIVASALPAFTHVTAGTAELTAVGDAHGIEEAIVALLRDDDRREVRRRAGHVRAQDFEGRTVASRFLTVYETAIDRHVMRDNRGSGGLPPS